MAANKPPQFPREEKITALLGQFQPTPSDRYYRRMAAAPWKRKSLLWRIPVPLVVAVGLVAVFWLLSPDLLPVVAFTNTPTLTNTATPSPTLNKGFIDTVQPYITDTPLAFLPAGERLSPPPAQTELPQVLQIDE